MKRILACLLVLAALAPDTAEAWGYIDFTSAGTTGITWQPVSDFNTPSQGIPLAGARGMSVSIWIRYTAAPSRHHIFSDFNGGSFDLRHDAAFGTFYWAVIGAGAWTTADVVTQGVWFNLTCTYDSTLSGDPGKCYRDGQVMNRTSAAMLTGITIGTSVGSMITSQLIDQWMPGHVSNLKFWGRGLAPHEVQGEMFCANPVNPQDLISWFPLDGHVKSAAGVPFHNNVTGATTAVVRFFKDDGPPIQLCGGG